MDPSQQLGFQPMQLQEPIGAFQQQAMPNFQASKTKMNSTIPKEKNEDKHAKSTLLVVFSCFCLVVILFCCIFVGDEVNDEVFLPNFRVLGVAPRFFKKVATQFSLSLCLPYSSSRSRHTPASTHKIKRN